jgi:hypothetical protein
LREFSDAWSDSLLFRMKNQEKELWTSVLILPIHKMLWSDRVLFFIAEARSVRRYRKRPAPLVA